MKCLLIVLFSFPLLLPAQNKPLVIAGAAPELYLNHTVAAKENYYSIGRIYNVSPREMAPFNKLDMEAGLTPGQKLKIPLSATNFLQAGNAADDEVLVPVYHTVGEKEGLFRVGANYNKLPIETIRLWNNLKSDAVSSGTNLVVGYLKVKKDLSPLVTMARSMPAGTAAKVAETRETVAPVKEAVKPVVAVTEPPVKKAAEVEKAPAPVVTKQSTPTGPKNFNGGVFKAVYESQTRNKDIAGETGQAAVFKSTSGWDDGKYYCLHNSSTPGTILKVTNAATGKSIYAKVLDVIPDISQNTGLLVRISNAAAEELGAGETKFGCTLSYSK